MDDEIVKILLPKKLCEIFTELAQLAAKGDSSAGNAVCLMLATATKKGGLQLDSTLLTAYKPYDRTTGQGGLNDEAILFFAEEMGQLFVEKCFEHGRLEEDK